MCTVLLPPGVNPIAVKYISHHIIYHIIYYISHHIVHHIILYITPYHSRVIIIPHRAHYIRGNGFPCCWVVFNAMVSA